MALTGLFSDIFQPTSVTCGYASTRDTTVLFAPLPLCGTEPDEIVFTTDGSTAPNAGTVNLWISGVNGAAATVGTKVYLSKGRRLKFGTTIVVVAKGVDITAIAAPGIAVQIDPAPALIATATASDITWPTSKLAGVQSVGMSVQDASQENADAEDFYTGDVVLGRKLTFPILMHQREENVIWKRTIWPALADPGLNVFAVIKKSAMPAIWGQFKLTAPDAPGESRTKVMHNFTLSSQKYVSVPKQYPSEMSVGDKAIYDSVLIRAGLSTALTQFD